MKRLNNYLSTKINKKEIIASDETIKEIVANEVHRLGNKANLNHIDVSKVKNFSYLFSSNFYDFCGDISKWDVSSGKTMAWMFNDCMEFNSDLSLWKTDKVVNMEGMFMGCRKFNQPIGQWNISNVENMRGMFYGCKKFNQDLSNWEINIFDFEKIANMFTDCPIEQNYLPKISKI